MRKFPLPFRGEGKGEGYAKIESQNAFFVQIYVRASADIGYSDDCLK